jgi:hypothetical protein
MIISERPLVLGFAQSTGVDRSAANDRVVVGERPLVLGWVQAAGTDGVVSDERIFVRQSRTGSIFVHSTYSFRQRILLRK